MHRRVGGSGHVPLRIVSQAELAQLRRVENVVGMGHVTEIEPGRDSARGRLIGDEYVGAVATATVSARAREKIIGMLGSRLQAANDKLQTLLAGA